jgi:hypothetical protein
MSTPVLLARTAHAEWRRIWTVRSSWAFSLATACVVLGLGTLIGVNSDPRTWETGTTAWDVGRPTAMFALFGILTLGVVTSAADHATRGIVPTLQWTPRRAALLAARTTVVVVTTTVLGLLLVAGASALVSWLMAGMDLPLHDGVSTLADLTWVFATGALLAVGLALLTRSTAAGLVCVIGLVLVLPFLLAQMPYDWAVETAARLPGSGVLYLIFGEGPTDDMTTASARVTLVCWAAAALATGGARLVRADAGA